MSEMTKCSECGDTLPEYWPKGLCARCAFGGALDGAASHVGDFELLEEVGRGGMGVIYRARQISLNRIVALKMILGGQFASKQDVLRFRSEAESAATLQHPNIVRIHETGERDGHHYFSMDYVEGRTLTDIARDGPLPAPRAAKYALGIAEAIHYAHSQGVLHRDLKPSNVIIDNSDQPRITDFGLAKRVRGDFGVTVTGQVLGSPNFMPPEQTSTKGGKVGPWSDVYGIGAILYHLLTGRPPFQAETIEEILLLLRDTEPVPPRLLNPSVPRDLETICLKCLEKDLTWRYGSAQALADELKRFQGDEPIEARPLGPVGRVWRWCKRRPATATLSASVLLLLLIVAFGSSLAAWRVDRARRAEQVANQDLRRTVSLLELERAEDFFNAQDSSAGVAHLAAILRRDPGNAIAASRLVSALIHRSWAVPSAPPMRHWERITSATFRSNGCQVLTASWDKTACVWDAITGAQIFKLGHSARMTSAKYSPDGGRIITTSAAGSAQIWDAATGEPRGPRMRHDGKINSSEFSADGRWIVTASDDRTARIWDAFTGTLKHDLRKHSGPVVLARFSSDGKYVATGGFLGSVRIWSADSGEVLFWIEVRTKPLTALAFSPDGRRLVSACEDGIAQLWDTTTGAPFGEPLVHRRALWHAVFSPDGSLLLTTCEDGAARLWDVQTLRLAAEPLRHESGVTFGEFSPDGRSVVTTSSDNTARVWDVTTGAPVCQPLRHIERVLYASFSSDGRRVVTASYDGIAQLWDLRERIEPGLQIRHGLDVAPFAFSPDGAALLTAARDKTARLWNSRTGEPLGDPMQHDASIFAGDCTAAGRRVVLGCSDGTIRVWECAESNGARIVAGPFRHQKAVRAARFNADGSRIVTASADGTARVWDAVSGEPATEPLPHSAEVVMAQFSRDGRFVVTASEDRTARVWDAQTGRPVTGPLVHVDHVKWADFSPDGQRVVTASTDNTACIWDVHTGQAMIPPLQHPRIVERAVFSPDGRRLATASADRMARVWDTTTGQAVTPPLRHDSMVEPVYFSADARRVVSVCRAGLARVWDANTGRPLTEWLDAGSYWVSCFDPVFERVAIGTRNRGVRIWETPRATTPVPEWFPAFAEALAGIRLGLRGTMELSSRDQLNEFARQVSARTQPDIYERIARGLLNNSNTTPAVSVGLQ